jgi:hypothetical protein
MTTAIAMKTVRSSSVTGVGYDPTTKTLTLRFAGTGKTYHYQGVPQSVVDGLHRAESIGKYVGQHIRGKYQHASHEA